MSRTQGLTADQRAERYKGFHVIKDTVEIDESLHDDDTSSIDDCFGSVLVEVPDRAVSGLTEDETFERAEELANESVPFGIARVYWTRIPEGAGRFVRFTVEKFDLAEEERGEPISKADFAADKRPTGGW